MMSKKDNKLMLLFVAILIVVGCGKKSMQGGEGVNETAASSADTMSSPIELRSVKITNRDGLPDNSIRKMYQDSKGFIWFGTLNGLSRYDGTRFVTFRKQDNGISLQDNRVKNIVEDGNGFLWVATNSGVYSCFDLTKDCFVDYTGRGDYKRKFTRMTRLHNGEVWLWGRSNGAMCVTYDSGKFTSELFNAGSFGGKTIMFVSGLDSSSVYVGTDSGLSEYSGGKIKRLYSGKRFCFAGMWKGSCYFITSDGSVFVKGDNNKLRNICKLPTEGILANILCLPLKDKIIVFAGKGSYSLHLKSGVVEKNGGEWDIPNAELFTDSKGGKWIANKTGVLRFVDKDRLLSFDLMPKDKLGYIDVERYHIVRDSRGLAWISTYGNGLFVYNFKTGTMQHFVAGTDANAPIVSNYLQYVMEDRSGSLWVSSEYAGLSHIWIMNEGVRRIFPEGSDRFDRSNTVRMIAKMPDGNISVGTRTGNVYTYDADMSEKISKTHYDVNVYSVCNDAKGTVWVGTRERGLWIGAEHYEADGKPGSISHNRIFCILKDRKNRMWVGSFGGGVNLAVPTKDGYKFRKILKGTPLQQEVRYLFQDTNGWIWVATSGGLFVFNPDRILKNSKEYYEYDSEKGVLLTDEARFVTQDHKGQVWIAAPGAGIYACDISKKDYSKLKFENYGQDDGLVNNMAQAIVEDRKGDLWVSTEYGVSCFDTKSKTFENYFFSQYIMGNVYSENSAMLLKDGNILFGTNYGLVVISPNLVERPPSKVRVTYTDLKINGLSVRPSDTDSPIKGALPYVDEMSLSNAQNSFIIEFSTFEYSDKDDIKYSYKLDNYDKEWSEPSTNAYAAYKNLPSGTYTLRTKACNSSGIWSKEAVMRIEVAPPFYFSIYAFLVYILIVAVAGYFIYRTVSSMNRLRGRIKLEEQLTKYKLTFFTNISHEFRTPLTLIQGSLEVMRNSGKIPKELRPSMNVLEKSTLRMLRLINQLLEFRKMQNGKLSLALENTDIMDLLRNIYCAFGDAAKSKSIDYEFEAKPETFKMYVDKRHVDKIVYNLLSNAFKYTPSNGRIVLSAKVNEEAGNIIIKVTDNGLGIPEDKREELFSRFMQSNYSGDSFGIGLHLTRELVAVHKGTIKYDSAEGGGSVFTVTLPTDASVYDAKDFLSQKSTLLKEGESEGEMASVGVQEGINDSMEDAISEKPLNRRRILLIEDDDDVRDFLAKELRTYFEVEVASDGRSGLEKAQNLDFDLVVTDVMMPIMNGFEVTKKLKEDFATSHIPVILLTALDNSQSRLEGVEIGADAYITKPFSPKYLLARMFNLIAQRDKLKAKFSKDISAAKPALCSTERDKEFVERLSRIMEHEIGNFQFSVDKFAEMTNMGRTAFFRKVKGVTGYTPNEYIRIMRMKKAAELLVEGKYTVSEISYKVGIDDPFYFSKCFKKQFGVPPSTYMKGDAKPETTV